MQKFALLVLIACTAQLGNARPDVSLGYRYNQGLSSGGADFLQGSNFGPNSFVPIQAPNGYYNTAGPRLAPQFTQSTNFQQAGPGIRYNQNYNNNYNQDFTSNYVEQEAYLNQLHHHEAPIITKHFYIHSAPLDQDEEQIVRHINIGRPQKNYRVVFIDAPTSTLTRTKIIANVAPVEDKTAIYVLSKKSTAADVSAEVVAPPPQENKPEVFYIKYKTPEEAVHAQHTIQAQYDALGGSTDVSNEGIIPATSVIGSLGHGIGSNGKFQEDSLQNIATAVGDLPVNGNNQPIYLPPKHKK